MPLSIIGRTSGFLEITAISLTKHLIHGIALVVRITVCLPSAFQTNALQRQPITKGYLSQKRTTKSQTSLRMRMVSPNHSHFAHTLTRELQEASDEEQIG